MESNNNKQRPRLTEDQWRNHVKEWEKTLDSQAAYAKRVNISQPRLNYWIQKIREERLLDKSKNSKPELSEEDQFWFDKVKEWTQSNESRMVFCSKYGISVATFIEKIEEYNASQGHVKFSERTSVPVTEKEVKKTEETLQKAQAREARQKAKEEESKLYSEKVLEWTNQTELLAQADFCREQGLDPVKFSMAKIDLAEQGLIPEVLVRRTRMSKEESRKFVEEFLRRKELDRSLTQKEFAEEHNLHQATLSRLVQDYKSGKLQVPVETEVAPAPAVAENVEQEVITEEFKQDEDWKSLRDDFLSLQAILPDYPLVQFCEAKGIPVEEFRSFIEIEEIRELEELHLNQFNYQQVKEEEMKNQENVAQEANQEPTQMSSILANAYSAVKNETPSDLTLKNSPIYQSMTSGDSDILELRAKRDMERLLTIFFRDYRTITEELSNVQEERLMMRDFGRSSTTSLEVRTPFIPGQRDQNGAPTLVAATLEQFDQAMMENYSREIKLKEIQKARQTYGTNEYGIQWNADGTPRQ